ERVPLDLVRSGSSFEANPAVTAGPGSITVLGLLQGLSTQGLPLSVIDASGDDSRETVFDKGALRVSYDFSSLVPPPTSVVVELIKDGAVAKTLGTFTTAVLN